MTEQRFSLGGTKSQDGFESLSEVLSQLLELKGGATKETEPPPSMAPPGQAMAGGGMQYAQPSQPDLSKPYMKYPKIPGMPTTQAGSEMVSTLDTGGGGGGGSFMSAGAGAGGAGGGAGAGAFAGTGGPTTVPTGEYSGIDTSGFTLTGNQYGSQTGGQPGDNKTSFGDAFGAFGELGDSAIDAYNAFSLDENEKAARTQRHLMEQQFAIRQNWKGIYEDYLLPIQTGTKMYAYQQLGKKSDNYEYASDMLKGMIEGSASVYAGQKDWDQVWDSLSKIPDENIPDTFAESWQSHYQNDIVNNVAWGITTAVLNRLLPGAPKGLPSMIALELLKIGNATIKSALDMKMV